MKIALGADNNGFVLKEVVKQHLLERGFEVADFGVDAEQDVDYPEIAEPVARAVVAGEVDRAVLICGTGLGMAIVANKFRGIRAAPSRTHIQQSGPSSRTTLRSCASGHWSSAVR